MSDTADGPSKPVEQFGCQRGDERGCAPSESLDLSMSIVDGGGRRRLDTDTDVSPPPQISVYSLLFVCLEGRWLTCVP